MRLTVEFCERIFASRRDMDDAVPIPKLATSLSTPLFEVMPTEMTDESPSRKRKLPNRRASGKLAHARHANIAGLSSRLISMITSAGILLRFAAFQIASALGAS